MNIQTGGKVSGVYGIKVLRNVGTDKEHLEDFGESPNMLLDGFFERFASGGLSPANWSMFVGSGTVPVAATQTQLVSQVGIYDAMTVSINDNEKVGSDYIASSTGVASWSIGAIIGNISEVGVRLGSIIGSTVDSRALIVDEQGNPTTIAVTAADKLEISYTLKYIIPIQQHVSVVDFLGVPTTCTLEALGSLSKTRRGIASAFANYFSSFIYWSSNRSLYNNVEENVIGLSTLSVGISYSKISSGVRRCSMYIGVDKMNEDNGIEYVCISSDTSYGAFYGVHFSPKIPKDSTKTLTLNFDFTLSRA